MDLSSDQRCKRNDGAKWRCSKAAWPGKSYCEKHLAQVKSRSQKNRINKNKEEEIEDCGNSRSWKSKKARVSSGSEGEASDSKLRRKSVRKQEARLSASSEKKAINGKSVNNSVKSVLKLHGGEGCSSGEERGRTRSSVEKPSMVTVGLKEILLI